MDLHSSKQLNRYRLSAYILVALFAGCYWLWGVSQQSPLNNNIYLTDQDAYLAFANNVKESGFTDTGSRSRMPLYVFIQAAFLEQGADTPAQFERGKAVNTVISFFICLLVLWIFSRHLPSLEAALVTTIVAFTVLAYKAPYFQAEVLYYGLSFLVFVLFAECIMHPRWQIGLASGGAAALAHLTKASVLPAVVLISICLLIHLLLDVVIMVKHRDHKLRARSVIRTSLTLVALVGTFLIILSPYLVESKARYGQYFYNVSSTFYVWYDSWEQAKAGTAAHGDHSGWPDMPADEIPSAKRYFETHSTPDIVRRVQVGLQGEYANLVHYRVAEYFLIYLGALIVIFLLNVRWLWGWVFEKRRYLVLLFIAGYFSGYALLYAFYSPIASGPRFVLSLVLPALICCAVLTSHTAVSQLPWSVVSKFLPRETISRAFCWALLLSLGLTLAWELAIRFPDQIATFSSSE